MIRDKGLAIAASLLLLVARSASPQTAPNIVLIYADDLGYGDVSAYGAKAVSTPNIDRLAQGGLRFTDAHSAAATCTPSRYALLTGEYAFAQARHRRPAGQRGADHRARSDRRCPRCCGAPATRPASSASGTSVSDPQAARTGTARSRRRRTTSASTIRSSWPRPAIACRPSTSKTAASSGSIRQIRSRSATTRRSATGRPARAIPSCSRCSPSHGHDQTIVNGISRIGYMTGGKAALWKDEDMADVFTRQAVALHRAAQRRGRSSSIFASHDPHVPRVPHPRFAGKTTMGPRGDAIVETDWSVGQVLDTLDRLKLTRQHAGHLHQRQRPGRRRRVQGRCGGEARQPQARRVRSAAASTATSKAARACRSSCAGRGASSRACRTRSSRRWTSSRRSRRSSNQPLARRATVRDSLDMLAALLGTVKAGRDELVEQAGGLALRVGQWKYIEPSKRPKMNVETNTELGNDAVPQLYDLPGIRRTAERCREIPREGRRAAGTPPGDSEQAAVTHRRAGSRSMATTCVHVHRRNGEGHRAGGLLLLQRGAGGQQVCLPHREAVRHADTHRERSRSESFPAGAPSSSSGWSG